MEVRKVLILIPARFASTRFPGKPLVMLGKKSMVQRVFENCLKVQEMANLEGPSQVSNETSKVDPLKIEVSPYVITDDDRIQEHVLGFGGKVMRVDDEVLTGTERIELAYKRYFKDQPYDLVINVQGDEPLLGPQDILKSIQFHLDAPWDIVTMVKRKLNHDQEFLNPNRVKAIYSEKSGECHFFTRAPMPHKRAINKEDKWFLHIGFYSYKPSALEGFCAAPPSQYELYEGLEQLRAIEHGLRIGAIEVNSELIGIDTPEDVSIVEGVLSEQEK